jgi:hypothetical protein
MRFETHIDRIERQLPSGEIDVVFVITNEGCMPRAACIHGENFSRRENETLYDLADRALQQYRTEHKPANNVSVLVMDCRH